MRRTSTLTSKGQVTVPIDIRRKLGLRPGQKVEFVERDGQVQIAPALSVTEATAGIFKSSVPYMSPREEKAVAEQVFADEAAYEGL